MDNEVIKTPADAVSSDTAAKLDPNIKHVSKKELKSFCGGLMGQNLVYGLIGTSTLQYFLTDVVVFPGLAVTILMILSRIWDGINDPLIGSIIDKHRFKNGEKLRPFLKLMPIPIGILSLLMFVILSKDVMWLNITYFVVIYLIWDVLYTLQDVPLWSMTSMMTPNPEERNGIVQWARLSGSTVFGIASAIIPVLIEIFADALNLGWAKSYILFAFIFGFGGSCISLISYRAKERVPVQEKQESIKESLSLLFKNKVLLLISLASILCSFGFGSSLTIYFFKYMIPSDFYNIPFIGFMGTTVIFSTLVFGPTLVAMFFAQKFKKLLGNMVNVLIFIQIANIVFRIIAYFIGYEGNALWISTIFLALGSFPSGMIGIAQTSVFNDSIDYVEWQTGKRTEGVVFSMQTLLTKISSGITAGMSLIFLYFVMKYAAAPETVTETIGYQNDTFNKLIWPLFILTPAIGSLLYIIPLKWTKYPKEVKDLVESDLTARREGLPESGKSPYSQQMSADAKTIQ